MGSLARAYSLAAAMRLAFKPASAAQNVSDVTNSSDDVSSTHL